jgi:hypothetical protein
MEAPLKVVVANICDVLLPRLDMMLNHPTPGLKIAPTASSNMFELIFTEVKGNPVISPMLPEMDDVEP